jgi:Rrf2 family iron-sulfur cluster assembly transcriptional regulator
LNEDTDTTRCGGAGDCQDGETCLTHYLWMDLSDQVRNFLQDISLGDLVKRQDIRRVSQNQERRSRDLDRAGDQIPASNL